MTGCHIVIASYIGSAFGVAVFYAEGGNKNLKSIFENTDFVHASGTREELQVAEYLKG